MMRVKPKRQTNVKRTGEKEKKRKEKKEKNVATLYGILKVFEFVNTLINAFVV